MARKAKPEPQASTADGVLALFTDQIVDLAVFTQGVTRYTIEDVGGESRTYEIPNDPPFPVALGFQRAHDRYMRARIDVAGARAKKSETAMLDKLETAWSDLVGRAADGERPDRPGAFGELLRIRHPDLGVAELRDQLGANVLESWMETVITRLAIARLEGGARTPMALLAQVMQQGGTDDPKANPGASSPSSDTSGD